MSVASIMHAVVSPIATTAYEAASSATRRSTTVTYAFRCSSSQEGCCRFGGSTGTVIHTDHTFIVR